MPCCCCCSDSSRAYSFSVGPCGYLLLGESSAPALRAKTAGVAAAGSGMFGLVFSYCTPLMILDTVSNSLVRSDHQMLTVTGWRCPLGH